MDLELKPQKGFQQMVWDCQTDIAIIGGSAGGGKTCSLVWEPLKYIEAPEFAAVFFRRDKERIRATGGLWSEAKKWYVEGEASESILKFRFPSGAQIDFEGIEYMKDLEKWQGTQIPLILFDELTEFEEEMFFFMLSRNRGIVRLKRDNKEYIIKPYCRASCNPKPNHWVSRLLEWYIDQETGFPIEERNGVVRYFIRHLGRIYWGNTKDEVIAACPDVFKKMEALDNSIKPHDLIKSFTFIRGTLAENKILTRNSPEYYANLLSMDESDQKRFLEGNWLVSSDGTDLFDFEALSKLFVSEPISLDSLVNYSANYIVCDAAKFGQDLCTIYVFNEWDVVHITIFFLSDTVEIVQEIEGLRLKFGVGRKNVIVDQDGIGGDVVRRGAYKGFVARRPPTEDVQTHQKDNYKTFKDQCYFFAAEKVNTGVCKFHILTSTVKVFDRGSKFPRWSTKLKWKGDMVDIRVLILEQIRAIKKGQTVLQDGGEKKYEINSKEEQKEILGGISPDLADPLCMRASFDLEPRRRGISRIS